jgi:hypothetical protein
MIRIIRFDMLTHNGELRRALAFAEDAAGWSNGTPQQWLDQRAAVTRTSVDRDKRGARTIGDLLVAEARRSAEATGRAIQELAILGRLDDAFALAEAYYFSRGFAIPDRGSTNDPAASVTLDSRSTWFLFAPPLEPFRADPRFGRLVTEIGLARYWREAGAQPDYRRR